MHCFTGNTAETRTLIPVLPSFQDRHGVANLVVLADAGMLSAGNLNAIEDAGFGFIVGSLIGKAPYDLTEHFHRHGTYFRDGQILESARGRAPVAQRRTADRLPEPVRPAKRDDRAINAMVDKAERVSAGIRPLKRDWFVKVRGADKTVDWTLVDRARQLAGLKGYVTNIGAETMTGAAVVTAYHDLWQVEKSFRMAKSDLGARPIFHHLHDAIAAHLTVVFAALAISRHLQDATGLSIKRLVRTLRELRSATIDINGQQLTLDPELTPRSPRHPHRPRPRRSLPPTGTSQVG